MVKRSSSIGSIVRKRLSDISSSLPQLKSPLHLPHRNRDFVDHLVKENVALARLVQERNKMIEATGIELRRLKLGAHKVQLQNWKLAQSNTHMAAELHFNREKVKALQHELVCKQAILKAKRIEDKEGEVGDSTPYVDDDAKSVKSNFKLQARGRKSMVQSTLSQQVAAKGLSDSKRRILRRQSACTRTQHKERAQKMCDLEEIARQYDNIVEEDVEVPWRQKVSCLKRTIVGRPCKYRLEK